MNNKLNTSLIMLLILIFSFALHINFSSNILFSFDEIQYKVFSDNFIESGNLCLEKEDFLTPTFPFSVNEGDCFYPTGSFMRILFLSFFTTILGSNLFFIIPAIFGTLIVLGIFLVSYSLSKNYIVSIISSIIVSTLPLLIHWSTLLYLDTLSLFIFLIMFSIFLSKRLNNKILFLGGILFSLYFLLRLSDIINIIPMLIFLLYRLDNKKKIIYFLLPVIIIILFLPLINFILFENFNFFPDANLDKIIGEEGNNINKISFINKIGGYFSFNEDNLQAMWLNSITFFKYIWIFSGTFIISFILLMKYHKFHSNNALFIYSLTILALFFIDFLFYSRGNLGYGVGRMSLQSSFLRYMLLPFILFIPIIAHPIKNYFLDKKKRIRLLLIFIFIIFSFSLINTVYDYEDYGLKYVQNMREKISESRQDINLISTNNSIFLVDEVGSTIIDSSHYNRIILVNYSDENYSEISEFYYLGAFYSGSDFKKNNLNLLETFKGGKSIELIYENNGIRLYKIIKYL